ncbi:winged helix-turn-helix domain-containing protein, partial [Escherichia coli]|uniref:winged helix-turn-helix domain-containing protein n=1 Tax=Escherichia coli TaxID=562 RepID=UPI002FE39540
MQQPVVRVGEWLVTPSINQISRNGRQLTLEPRLIDLLVFFAQHSGEVLSRDELIDNVWKRSIVTNHVVTQSGFAPIFPDTCYHLTHYWPAAADIP